MIQRVIVAGGGTGGHLFPGIAVVEELRRRAPEVEVTFVGTSRGIEARVLPEMGERLELIEVTPLKGRSKGELMRSLMKLPGAFARATGLVRQHKPQVVIGVGGYASGPMLLAAAALGVKTALLEQNAHVGLTNRVLGPVAGRAYVAFESAAEAFGASRARLLGNPVRRGFVDAARAAMVDPEGFEARANRVLVLGGSQGAKALNERIPEALASLGLRERGLTVLHQTGEAMRADVEARYRALGIEADVRSFISDMASAYASASVVIARAGATTLAEVAAMGRPSILVPYPFAADDHQTKNARALESLGAAVCVQESELEGDRLATVARRILDDASLRADMARAARGYGRPDAAAAIVDDLLGFLGIEDGEGAGERSTETRASEREPEGDAFMSVDFRARRGLRIQAQRRSTNPPPPAYLEVLPAAALRRSRPPQRASFLDIGTAKSIPALGRS